jgi:hypothetical protein
MDDEHALRQIDPALYEDARAVAAGVAAIRRLQNKSLPRDFAPGTPAWEAAALEFATDLQRALDAHPPLRS